MPKSVPNTPKLAPLEAWSSLSVMVQLQMQLAHPLSWDAFAKLHAVLPAQVKLEDASLGIKKGQAHEHPPPGSPKGQQSLFPLEYAPVQPW